MMSNAHRVQIAPNTMFSPGFAPRGVIVVRQRGDEDHYTFRVLLEGPCDMTCGHRHAVSAMLSLTTDTREGRHVGLFSVRIVWTFDLDSGFYCDDPDEGAHQTCHHYVLRALRDSGTPFREVFDNGFWDVRLTDTLAVLSEEEYRRNLQRLTGMVDECLPASWSIEPMVMIPPGADKIWKGR